MRATRVPIAAALLLAAAPSTAQEPPPTELELPAAVADQVMEFYNRPATIRLMGESHLPRGAELIGDVAVIGGPFVVAGTIRGRLVVINGDVRLEPGAAVTGGLTVVGGGLSGLPDATVAGSVLTYREPLRYRRAEGRIAAAPAQQDPGLSAGRQFDFGRTDLHLAVRGGYNRVEGLPIAGGARAELGGSNPTWLEALLIYRSESGVRLNADELGYLLRVEQLMGGRRALRVGALLRSEIVPIEDWGLSDRENSLATFLLHRDYRDHYERQGWSAYLRAAPRGEPYALTIEYREEKHRTVPAGGPWSLVDNDRDWRPQPVVAEGELRSVAAHVGYDSRNAAADASSGWYLAGELEMGLGGTLTHPFRLDPDGGPPIPEARAAAERFTSGFLDLRRYIRLGPGSRMALRFLTAGSLDEGPLPPQRQRALGGPGSLPAYSAYRFDCGARDHVLEFGQSRFNPRSRFVPFYGCDRIALVQLEYEARLPVRTGLGRRLGWDVGLFEPVSWTAFFDAGRAWTEEAARAGRGAGSADFSVDAGIGLRIGRVGLYWAAPLSGGEDGINFFARIGSRF